MEQNNAIQTGTEYETDVRTPECDIYAYADDGEHATVFAIDRVDDTTVHVGYYRCEAGLSEFDCEERFDIDADKTTEQWAEECANADPEMSVKVARDYWD